ncbi:MAG: (Fe-S)-binding protein [Thermodesulfobacteriota bacterium]
MADIQELTRMLAQLEEQMVTCMRCGMCQAACPLYAETGRETDVARGKIVLLEHLSQELLKDPQGVKQRLENCLLCGSCAAACPSGVKVLDLFLQARAIINGYLGLPPAKKAVFRFLLTKPALFNSVASLASRFQGLFTKPADELLGSSCARFESKALKDRHFMPLASTPWHKQVPSLQEKAGASNQQVAFFPGCLVDKVFPAVAQSVCQALRYHQVGIYMPAKQSCCGIPALSSGDRHSFQQLVRNNLKLFAEQNYQVLVTPCATCTATIKKIWPAMADYFSPQEQEQIKQVAAKTMDITQFLADNFSIAQDTEFNANKTRLTYHDPCHLKKSLQVFQQPRKLLSASQEYELVEMPEADRCCGMGGSFGLEHYDLSRKVGERKLQNILHTEAEVVSTACPACMLQIIDLLSHQHSGVQVKHPVQIYAGQLPQQ